MRHSVWDQPRVIGCAENFPQHIALPCGCLEPLQALLQEQGIGWELLDERQNGSPLELTFADQLRADQQAAVEAMLRHDIGVLQAPTAFGKTVVAAAILARRGVNTLVLVHRAELLRQWQERLETFLDVPPEAIGCIGGGKAKPSGRLDIAVMQSLVRKGEVNPLVQTYGQVIVDECHHIAAALAEQVPNLFLLHGRLSARQRSASLAALEALPPEAPRIVLATGRLVGEGFDHPPLDTLLLAMPVSWKGTLQQYAGRLHRQQAGKTSVRIIDWLDLGHPVPQRMWERRLRGYRAMGYSLISDQ